MNNEVIFNITDEIITTYFHEYLELYEFEKIEILNMIKEQNINSKRETKLNQFGIPIEQVPAYLACFISTATLMFQIYKFRKEKKNQSDVEVKVEWEVKLNIYEIDEELKEKIIKTHLKKLIEEIKSSK